MVIQGSVRRVVLAFIVALVVATALVYVKHAEAQVAIPSGCKGLTTSDAAYWMRHCYLYPANIHHQLIYVRVR